ncbi:MAG: hypothetical protein KDC43_29525 [Saprospiraceae bacterium]|nr:hypothetical protein [Saprospiraceae bacterium]
MTFPVDTGVPTHAAVIPEVWAGKLLIKFYEATVFTDISNTDYEGSIKSMGDTVHIRTTPDITISDYVKGQQLSHEQPQPAVVDLLIDKGKYWSFIAQYVDRAQFDYDFVDDWTNDASSQMKITIDSDVLGSVYADAATANQGATAGAITSGFDLGTQAAPESVTKANILDYIVDMGTVLDEQSVPEEGRYVVLPPWACGLVKKSDLQDASLAGDGTSLLRNGRIGMIDRFTIYRSNQLAVTTGVTNALFGHKSAITFATQLTENEGPLKHSDYFGDFYRGLQVFGYEVIKDTALGCFRCVKG